MALSKKEAQEWRSLQAKSKRHGVLIKRVGPANVSFGDDIYAQLGTGHATSIMDARIKVKARLMARGFNHRGRRYTYSVTRGMSHTLTKVIRTHPIFCFL